MNGQMDETNLALLDRLRNRVLVDRRRLVLSSLGQLGLPASQL